MVRPVRPEEIAASYTLLPELLGAVTLAPDALLVCDIAQDSRPLGAAALVPVLHDSRQPGFRGFIRVLPSYRRRRLGCALAAALAQRAAAWGVPWLHAWDAVSDGPEQAFLAAAGFTPAMKVLHFRGEIERALSLATRRLHALQHHGRIPPCARVVPLAEVPLDAIVALYRCQLGHASHDSIARALTDASCRETSAAVCDGSRLLGFLLTRPGEAMPTAELWVSDPSCRHGWVAAMTLQAVLARVAERGAHAFRFHCNDRTQATLNFAHAVGAVLEGTRTGYALDLRATGT